MLSNYITSGPSAVTPIFGTEPVLNALRTGSTFYVSDKSMYIYVRVFKKFQLLSISTLN